ncbi:MAG: c-type cytochrome, partial [Calditrichae bacterium]|nr:c-type cytochrome [Calditrichia bacterium]NIW78767.1 c-type cytochrome [Calditrichia bacterium]
EKGNRLIRKFNCRGCHVVGRTGGHIQEHLKAKTQYPPPLEMGTYHVGERLKGSWLFSFLKAPTPVRTWMKVRMPTFSLTDQEVRDFTAY